MERGAVLSILHHLAAMLIVAAAVVWLPAAVVIWATCRRVGRPASHGAGQGLDGG
jgi:hypothetical protein